MNFLTTRTSAVVFAVFCLIVGGSWGVNTLIPSNELSGGIGGTPAQSGPWVLAGADTCGVDVPAAGTWSLDAGFPYNTTALICLSETTVSGLDLNTFLSKFTDQDGVFIQNSTDPSDQALFDITAAPTDQGTYYTFPVTLDNRVGQQFKDGERQIFQSQQPSAGPAQVFLSDISGGSGTHGYLKWWAANGTTSGDSLCGTLPAVACYGAYRVQIPVIPVLCSDTPASNLHFALCGK